MVKGQSKGCRFPIYEYVNTATMSRMEATCVQASYSPCSNTICVQSASPGRTQKNVTSSQGVTHKIWS